ncbi:helix-turn-helix domain-containing protein [Falsiroseomonas sp. HC035]|uniref:helix-turn-helix domain-containing protein n=1 Tax=Falsiroseomonas sp. HC035 TaxID=3390999 RepID=UPI003D31B51E
METNAPGIDRLVSANIKRYRLASGLKLREVAQVLGVSIQLVQRIESGNVRISSYKLLVLSGLLSCSIDDLFEGAEASRMDNELGGSNGILGLSRAFALIENEAACKALAAVAKALADASVAIRLVRHAEGPEQEATET